jgi:hypothetical protein
MRIPHPEPSATSPMITNYPPIRNQTSSSQSTPTSPVGACSQSTPASARREEVRVTAPRPSNGTPAPAHRHPQSQRLPCARSTRSSRRPTSLPPVAVLIFCLLFPSYMSTRTSFKTHSDALTVPGARHMLLVRCTRCAPPAVRMGRFASRSRSQTIPHPSHTCVSCVLCASHRSGVPRPAYHSLATRRPHSSPT